MNKLIVLLCLLVGCGAGVTSKLGVDAKNAYDSVCKISSISADGSGVLLDTGFVLTAAHVVDSNENGKIDYDELTCKVEFFKPGIAQVFTGTVLFVGDYLNNPSHDVAIMALPSGSPRGSISLVSSETFAAINYGDEIFTLGCPRGKSPKIFSGLFEYQDSESVLARGSFTSIMGSSGGGVYTNGGQLIGIITQNFAFYTSEQLMIMVPIPTEGGMAMSMGTGSMIQLHYAPNWSLFVSATQINNLLLDNGLDYVIRPMKRIKPLHLYFAILFNLILLVALGRALNEFWPNILR